MAKKLYCVVDYLYRGQPSPWYIGIATIHQDGWATIDHSNEFVKMFNSRRNAIRALKKALPMTKEKIIDHYKYYEIDEK